MVKFELKGGLVITDNEDGELKEGRFFIQFISLWKWLLLEEGVMC